MLRNQIENVGKRNGIDEVLLKISQNNLFANDVTNRRDVSSLQRYTIAEERFLKINCFNLLQFNETILHSMNLE